MILFLFQNIVHLDLKPENIVCCKPDNNEVKIIDFGLAREIRKGDSIKVRNSTKFECTGKRKDLVLNY